MEELEENQPEGQEYEEGGCELVEDGEQVDNLEEFEENELEQEYELEQEDVDDSCELEENHNPRQPSKSLSSIGQFVTSRVLSLDASNGQSSFTNSSESGRVGASINFTNQSSWS